MNKELIEALEYCISSTHGGKSREECLAKYPEFATQLDGLLNTVEIVESIKVNEVSNEVMRLSARNLYAHAKLLQSEQRSPGNFARFMKKLSNVLMPSRSISSVGPLATRLVLALGIAVVLILLSGGIFLTSAKSLPGDSLYPIKIAMEDLRVYLAPGVEGRQQYENTYTLQKVEEVKTLIDLSRQQNIGFEGLVTSIKDNTWIVGGVPVRIQSNTIMITGITGITSIEPGMYVEVEGTTDQQGWVNAAEIHLHEYQLSGVVEDIKARMWKIAGNSIRISADTQIDTDIEVGDPVTVLIHSQDDGIVALAILHNLYAATPTTTPSPLLTGQPTSEYDHESSGELVMHATLDQISSNYWVVDGAIVYIVADTHIAEGINVGDRLVIKYTIENNGSLTAYEIELDTAEDDAGENNDYRTAEPTQSPDTEQPEIKSGTEEPDHSDGTSHPDEQETPVPTETPER